MQFPDSTLVALDLTSHEPSRFGRTLVTALVLTTAAIGAALWVEVDTTTAAATTPPPPMSSSSTRPTR